jgi:chromosome segregation ATPase
MADEPITLAVLARFHQDVLLPDVREIVRAGIDGLRLEMHAGFDSIEQRLDRLETEYHMLVAGVKRIEERLDRVEQKLDRAALKSELLALKVRVEALERRLSDAEG